jgi:DNA-binding transcriptional ArsR family regulator
VSAAAEPLDAALRALADGTRRRILEVVREQSRPVGEIAQRVDMSQQAVSHHLSVLRGAGLVVEHRAGTKHLYVVNADGLRVVQEYLGGFWPAQLSNLKRAAENAALKRRRG